MQLLHPRDRRHRLWVAPIDRDDTDLSRPLHRHARPPCGRSADGRDDQGSVHRARSAPVTSDDHVRPRRRLRAVPSARPVPSSRTVPSSSSAYDGSDRCEVVSANTDEIIAGSHLTGCSASPCRDCSARSGPRPCSAPAGGRRAARHARRGPHEAVVRVTGGRRFLEIEPVTNDDLDDHWRLFNVLKGSTAPSPPPVSSNRPCSPWGHHRVRPGAPLPVRREVERRGRRRGEGARPNEPARPAVPRERHPGAGSGAVPAEPAAADPRLGGSPWPCSPPTASPWTTST